MHFWIDKPAARYCGFSGRRYPAMSFPKAHFGQRSHRCNDLHVGRLQMVTPVHRFQTINSGGSSAGPSNPSSSRPPRPSAQNNNDNRNNSGQTGLQLGQDISNNVSNISNNQEVLPPSTRPANRDLPLFSQFHDAEMAGYRLRCSVWIIFVLATGFLAAAKYYFDHQQGAGVEVLVFCALIVTFFVSGCFYSIVCRRARNHLQREEIQAEPIATVTVANTIPNESIRQVSVPVRQNPPPPYHIAILIPPPTSPDEAPPPAYDKIIQ